MCTFSFANRNSPHESDHLEKVCSVVTLQLRLFGCSDFSGQIVVVCWEKWRWMLWQLTSLYWKCIKGNIAQVCSVRKSKCCTINWLKSHSISPWKKNDLQVKLCQMFGWKQFSKPWSCFYLSAMYFSLSCANFLGICDHGKGCSGASFELKVDHLMVADVVVAVVRTPTVRPGTKCLRHALDIWHVSHHRNWPSTVALHDQTYTTSFN